MEFTAYSTLEEMVQAMEQAEAEANARTTDEQKAITWGDYWMRVVQMGSDRIAIFGRIWTIEELLASEKKHGATPDELRYTEEHEKDMHERGYRFGTAWSIMEPRGELGSTHVSTMLKITEQQFEAARRLKWNVIA